jgi:hypothetical protein
MAKYLSQAKVRELRNAIDMIEGALCGLVATGEIEYVTFFRDLMPVFEGSRDDMKIMIRCNVGQLRRLCKAFDECNRIINSPEYDL